MMDFFKLPPLIPVKLPVKLQEMRGILAQAEGLEQVADCVWRRPFVAD
jgi:hypothetical protein